MNLFKTSDDIVREIHAEFDNAQELLLKEANEILGKAVNKEIQVGELHNRLGFVSSPAAKRASLIIGEKEKAEETANLVNYYKQHYPFQKFLTEAQLDQICEKYNLIYAPIKNYKKDVPEKNLRDIANAKELEKSLVVEDEMMVVLNGPRYSPQSVAYTRFVEWAGKTEFTEAEIIDLFSRAKVDYYSHRLLDFVYYITRNSHIFGGSVLANESIVTTNKTGLFIAAPKSHFDLTNLSKKGKYGFLNITVREVKDPVVFRYCKGGIQVITKWGIEAEDELLQNEIDN